MHPQELFNVLASDGIKFYAGVPDSLLKSFCSYVMDHTGQDNHIITANEGNAIGLMMGYYLATGKIGVVYMQNSGLGNCVNPLVSLIDKQAYAVPVLLMIGWRGEPGVADEPQHHKQGLMTQQQLDILGIAHSVLPLDAHAAGIKIKEALHHMRTNQQPYALLIQKGTFDDYKQQVTPVSTYPLLREAAIAAVISVLNEEDIVVSTTGKASRELFEMRNKGTQHADFLTIGGMGHASSIALGIAHQKPERQIFCFDGDGALIMHMGALSTIGNVQPENFKHIVFNNFAHDSVGGQPTAAASMNIPALAKANGYRAASSAITTEEITQAVHSLKQMKGPALLEIKIKKGARKDLTRPNTSPQENKEKFMQFLGTSIL